MPPVPAPQPRPDSFSSPRLPRQRWHIPTVDGAVVDDLVEATGLSSLLAQVLVQRGIVTPDQAQDYLNPERLQLPSPLMEFPDLAASVELLVEAIQGGKAMAICGDYDADGMTSTALLLRALRILGAKVNYTIPSRMSEGYGINQRIVEDCHAEGVQLILTVDNGIAALAPVRRARDLGLTVIITDHHDLPPELPPANAILNPKLLPESSPYRGVAGVGVAYILAVCLAQTLDQTQNLTTPLLELFTLGTIADLAPLTGVNRRWVRRGLALLPKSQISGIQALIQVAGLADQSKALKPEHIGFRLGPRINAVGRISDPQIVIDLLTTEDVGNALERAMQCEQINATRQDLCQQIEQEAIAWCEQQQAAGTVDLRQDRVLLVVQPDWHHGVIGIVASRLVERYGVPVFIGTYEDEDGSVIRGSARGIPEFDVFAALQACAGVMAKFGGHRAAGGFSFLAENLPAVKAKLVESACQQLTPDLLKPLVTVDAQARLGDITFDLYEQIDHLHPCGIANPDPVFWTPQVQVLDQQVVGRNRDHLKLLLGEGNGGKTIKAIAWRWGEYYPLPERVDIAYKLKQNEWQGVTSVELELVGVRPSDPTFDHPPHTISVPSPVPRPAPSSEPPPPVTHPISAEPGKSAASEKSSGAPTVPAAAIPFTVSHRSYHAIPSPDPQQFTITNPEGHELRVNLATGQGMLAIPGESPQSLDIAAPRYVNLIQLGWQALELQRLAQVVDTQQAQLETQAQQLAAQTAQLAEQTWTVQAQEVQLAELAKQLQAETAQLTAQIQHLQAQVETQAETQRHPPPPPQSVSATTVPLALENPPQVSHRVGLSPQIQEDTTQIQEDTTQIQEDGQIQRNSIQTQQKPQPQTEDLLQLTMPTLGDIGVPSRQREVRSILGDGVWSSLAEPIQQDLCQAFDQREALAQAGSAQDFSAAAMALGRAVQRAVLEPLRRGVAEYGQQTQDEDVMALAIALDPITLHPLPALLAESWSALSEKALQSATKPRKALYQTIQATDWLGDWAINGESVNDLHRALLDEFLQGWEHPLGRWMVSASDETAAGLAQVHQLHQVALHPNTAMPPWQYHLLHQRVVGDRRQGGLFQQIFA